MATKERPPRGAYPYVQRVTARWMDNDAYGHVNNAHYYSFFDTAINQYLIARGGLDIRAGGVVAFIVSSGCDYFSPLSYPADLEVGVRADRIGRSSVTYGMAVFGAGDEQASAAGFMTHVFVDRATTTPVEIPPALRQALEAIASPAAGERR